MKIKDHTYPDAPTVVGELSELFVCECGQTIAKVATIDNSELVMEEAMLLGALRTNCPNPKLIPYLPEPVSFGREDDRWVNVFTYLDGFYTLEQVHDRFPELDPRDMAWMFRRLMVVLGYTKEAKMIHGAVVPSHVLIHPEKHGLVLIDWAYAVEQDEDDGKYPATLLSMTYKDWYPPEIHTHNVSPSTDVCMAGKCMIYLLGGDAAEGMAPDSVDWRLKNFFRALTQADFKARPGHPWEAQKAFDTLIEELWGPRKFRPFTMETLFDKEGKLR